MKSKLEELPFFSSLSSEELANLGNYLKERSFEAGKVVLPQGINGSELYILLSGTISVYVTLPGNIQREAAKLHAGQIFGEATFLTNEPTTVSKVAETDCVCLIFYRKILKMLRLASPDIAYKIEQCIAYETVRKIINYIHNTIAFLERIPPGRLSPSIHALNLPNQQAIYTDIDINSLRFDFIKRITFFKDLDDEDVQSIFPYVQARVYDKGYVFTPEKHAGKIGFLYSGAVMLFIKEGSYLKRSIAVSGWGSLFVEDLLMPELNTVIQYVACEKSIILELDYQNYEKLKEFNPGFFYKVSQYVHCNIVSLEYIVNRQFIRMHCEYNDVLNKEH